MSQILASASGGATSDYLRDDGAALIASLTVGVRSWYGTDNQGSVRQMLDDGGNVLTTQNYDPYGQPETASQIGSFGYTGELQDGTTGAVDLRARWYQPATGTLLGVDPMLDTTGQAYGYAGGDPVNGSDPSGACFALAGKSVEYWANIGSKGQCTDWDLYNISGMGAHPELIPLAAMKVDAPGYSPAAADTLVQEIEAYLGITSADGGGVAAGVEVSVSTVGAAGAAETVAEEGTTLTIGSVLGAVAFFALPVAMIEVGILTNPYPRCPGQQLQGVPVPVPTPIKSPPTAPPVVTQTPGSPVNRGSIQIQGSDINAPGGTISWSWARSGPVPAREGLAELAALWSTLSRRQQAIRDQAYARAQKRIQTAPPLGLPQGVHLPYQNDPGRRGRDNTARIDLVVDLGVAFNVL